MPAGSRRSSAKTKSKAAPPGGIHEDDFALGTGSYDGIFGVQSFMRYRAVFFQADTQFALRGERRYSYHVANDLSGSGSPGVDLHLGPRES